MDTAQFAAQAGLTSSVNAASSEKIKIIGSVVGTRLVDGASPIAYGYGEKVAAYCDNGPVFSLTSIAGSRRRRRLGPAMGERPTGRGSKSDPDFAVGRNGAEAPDEPESEMWEAPPVTDEQRHNNPRVIPPAMRARVVLRYADAKDLLISGLVEGGGEIAQHPAVVDAPLGNGHGVEETMARIGGFQASKNGFDRIVVTSEALQTVQRIVEADHRGFGFRSHEW